jgi:hypothetical protein
LTDGYRSNDIETGVYDADSNNETLRQFYGRRDAAGRLLPSSEQTPTKGVHVFNIRRPNERDTLLDLVQHGAQRAIIDLPGGGAEDVVAVLNSTDAFFGAFIEAGVTPIVVIVISNSKSSAAAVGATIEAFGTKPLYVVARNRHFGSEFPVFDGIVVNGRKQFGRARALVEEIGGYIVDFPELQNETWGRWDIASCPLSEAGLNPYFSYSDKKRIDLWRDDFGKSIMHTPLAIPGFIPKII